MITKRTFFILALLWIAGGNAFADQILKDIAAVRNLSKAVAGKHLPVEVIATVLLCAGKKGPLVVTDGTGIWCSVREFVDKDDVLSRVLPGDIIAIEGHTDDGHSASVIVPDGIRLVGKSVLPEPREVDVIEFHSGVLDSQWVVFEGVVQQVEPGEYDSSKTMDLILAVPGGKLLINAFPPLPNDADQLVDAEVRVTGVCIPLFNNRADVLESMLLISGTEAISVTKPALQNPFDAPMAELAGRREFSTIYEPRHRQKFIATVSAASPGESFHLLQGERGMKVYTSQKDSLSPGDIVECVGFVEMEERYPVIKEAVFRKKSFDSPPIASATSVSEILNASRGISDSDTPDMHARPVHLEGTLSRIEGTALTGWKFFLDCGGTFVEASLPERYSPAKTRLPKVGSLLGVSGIAEIGYTRSSLPASYPEPSSVRLLLRDMADIQVLRAPAWWNRARLRAALIFAIAVVILAFTWAATLRKRVTLRSAELAEEMRARRDSEIEFTATLRERERLAADLHDNLEQTLTGVALQIHATRTAPDKQRAERNLGLAEQMLGRSREEVRRSVWNLRSDFPAGASLSKILQTSCQDFLTDTSLHFHSETIGIERPVNHFLIENLLLLTKEALTNAIKHSGAEKISLETNYTEDAVTVVIADDGKGFFPEATAGPHEGHFGLTGMKERALRIEASISIESTPDKGTKIAITVPSPRKLLS